jgi:hypothetical protein
MNLVFQRVKILSQHPEEVRTEENRKTSVGIVGVVAESQTGDLSDTTQEYYLFHDDVRYGTVLF